MPVATRRAVADQRHGVPCYRSPPMGLVVSRFRCDDPRALLPALRARTASILGSNVSLALEPTFVHVTALGLNVLVFDRGHDLEVVFGGMSWVAGASPRGKRVRAAFTSRGGRERWGLRSTTYKFSGEPPAVDEIASSLGGRIVQRHPVWAVLRSGLRTPVEVTISRSGFDLEAPTMIFGRLFESDVSAAQELATPTSLGAAPADG
jgi:hypothetical protein